MIDDFFFSTESFEERIRPKNSPALRKLCIFKVLLGEPDKKVNCKILRDHRKQQKNIWLKNVGIWIRKPHLNKDFFKSIS